MTWRYETINCVKRWFNYAIVGSAEVVKAVVGGCVKGAIVGGLLIAVGPSTASIPPSPLPSPSTALPGVPGASYAPPYGSSILGNALGAAASSAGLISPLRPGGEGPSSTIAPVSEPPTFLLFLAWLGVMALWAIRR